MILVTSFDFLITQITSSPPWLIPLFQTTYCDCDLRSLRTDRYGTIESSFPRPRRRFLIVRQRPKSALGVLSVDFDGVIHSYTSPWTGVLDINDPPVPGAIGWLEAMALDPDVQIIIHSCRLSLEPKDAWYWEPVSVRARQMALEAWLILYGFPDVLLSQLEVWAYKGKPHATVYLDDRGYRFQGDFPSLETLRALKQWNKP